MFLYILTLSAISYKNTASQKGGKLDAVTRDSYPNKGTTKKG